ncbi:epoxyqueuosine reductase QueH [Petrotoga sp. 9PWA.NaAc.5.4]|uniref:epoxyqueuosine reductase QueH n=1 Tax=Petrotoga sp. 9PWA.NaAc.5.4 TaxID=1434328 RepID=UPI000EFCF29B|nr:epoxyqueuosine reductase QueH [Petrotoga sp. 9PWA.NaAc.5.4]
MKIILHTCCAPDLTISYKKLKEKLFEPTVFFYNPNIYPQEEYYKRLSEVKKLQKFWDFKLLEGPYEPEKYYEIIKGLENDKALRCVKCMELRISKTKAFAEKFNYDFYSSTLLASPRKSHKDIMKITQEINNNKTNFVYENFRSNNGIKEASKICKSYNIYRQNYCGCFFSSVESEKYEEESKKKNYAKIKEILGETITEKLFEKLYKKDLLKIPEDISYNLLKNEGYSILKCLKPQIILMKKNIAAEFGIKKNGRYKVDNWKVKIILW